VAASRWLPWIATAAFACLALLSAMFALSLREESATLRTERELATTSRRLAQVQLDERTFLAEKMVSEIGTRLQRAHDLSRLQVRFLASPLANLPEARGAVLWDPEQKRGQLSAEGLPAIADTLDYQVWINRPAPAAPVSAGVFRPDSTGRASVAIALDSFPGKPVSLTVSIERKGGDVRPAGPVVLVAK